MEQRPEARALRIRATITTVLLGLAVAASIGYVLAEWDRLALLEDLLGGRQVTIEEADASDRRVASIGIFSLITFLGGLIAWLTWVHRANRTLRYPVQVPDMHFTPGWAVGWWFVPFANFVQPVRVVSELWRGSAGNPGDPSWRRERLSPLIAVWWALMLGDLIGARVVVRMLDDALDRGDLQGFIDGVRLSLGHEVVSIFASVLWVVLLWKLQRRMEGAVERAYAAGTVGAPPPPTELGWTPEPLPAVGWMSNPPPGGEQPDPPGGAASPVPPRPDVPAPETEPPSDERS